MPWSLPSWIQMTGRANRNDEPTTPDPEPDHTSLHRGLLQEIYAMEASVRPGQVNQVSIGLGLGRPTATQAHNDMQRRRAAEQQPARQQRAPYTQVRAALGHWNTPPTREFPLMTDQDIDYREALIKISSMRGNSQRIRLYAERVLEGGEI